MNREPVVGIILFGDLTTQNSSVQMALRHWRLSCLSSWTSTPFGPGLLLFFLTKLPPFNSPS